MDGVVGSHGGPESASTPLGIVLLLTPSLFLGSSFLVLTISIQQLTAPEKKICSHAAVAFATVYTILIGIVYFVQLTLALPRPLRGQVEGVEVFLFVPFDSFLYAVDILGYSFMSVATLFAGMVFTGKGIGRIVFPFIALQMHFHPLIWIVALWAVTFPGSTWSLAILFRRAATTTTGFEPL